MRRNIYIDTVRTLARDRHWSKQKVKSIRGQVLALPTDEEREEYLQKLIRRKRVMRLIDAENIRPWRLPSSISEMQAWIESQPTIDAVPVVRCKDCKYTTTPSATSGEYDLACCRWICKHATMRYDYCSCGERKNNETD